MYKKNYEINGYTVKSYLEWYFALWLNELQEQGYVEKWKYEALTYPLFKGLSLPYKQQLATKVKDCSEHILAKASYTEDFYIYWTKKACNVFYLDPTVPIKDNVGDIPFRLGNPSTLDLFSLVDVKSTNASTTSSSVSQPYKAKWVYDKYGVLIHKIYPFSLGKVDYKKTLFYQTFYPKQVLIEEVYQNNTKYGKVGNSKIKHEIKTFKQFINDIKRTNT